MEQEQDAQEIEVEEEMLEAPPPSPRETRDLFHTEAEQVIIQEFSLEEANFSGCNLSGLNLSFESGISDPLAVEPTISKHFGEGGEEMATIPADLDPKNIEKVPPGLYTLACISDLAEKLTIAEPVTPTTATLNDTSDLLNTPVQCKNSSPSRLYSPISPADLSSQYLDAIDESIPVNSQDISKLPSGQVIEAIVSLQNQLQDKFDIKAKTASETSEVPELVITSLDKISKQEVASDLPVIEPEVEEVPPTLFVQKDDSILQNDSLCNEEDIRDVSLPLLSSDDSVGKDNDLSHHSSLMNDTIDEMDMILSMGVSYLETRDQNSSRADITSFKSEEKLNEPEGFYKFEEKLSEPELVSPFMQAPPSSKKYFCTPQMKSSRPMVETQGSAYNADPASSAKITPAAERAPLSQKKYFQSPAIFKTPVHAKISNEGKCASVGSSAKTDAASRVHVLTPFRVPKTAEPRSADFKHPSSRLPKASRNISVAHITSPVSQYIHGPVVAPRIAVVHSKSPLTNPPRLLAKPFESKMPVPKSRQEVSFFHIGKVINHYYICFLLILDKG